MWHGWGMGWDGVRGVESGWVADLVAFGLVVVGFGVSMVFGALKVVGLWFLTGFGVSKVVVLWNWRRWGCFSLVLGFQQLLQGGGWLFGGFNSIRMLTWHGCGCRQKRGGVGHVNFVAIDLDGVLTWQLNGLWVAVRRSEMA